jgi:hypothetical protein
VVQVLAGARLRTEVPERQRRWIRALEAIHREDRLVASDGRRFVEGILAGLPKARTHPATKGKEPRLVASFRLTEGVIWKTVVGASDRFYAAGLSHGMLRIVRGDWTGKLQSAMIVGQKGHISSEWPIALAVGPQRSSPVKMAVAGAPAEGQYYFGSDDHFGPSQHAALHAGSTSAGEGTSRTVGLCYALGMLYEFVWTEEQFLIHGSVVSDSEQTALHDVVNWHVDPNDLPDRFPVQGSPAFLAVGIGHLLLCRSRQSGQWELLMDAPIESLAITPAFTRLRLAVGHPEGGSFQWAETGHELGNPIRFGADLTFPQVCFTGSGLLVAVGENGGEIYKTQEGKLTAHQRMPTRRNAPLAVAPVEMGDRFAVFEESGEVRIYDAS